MHQVRQLSGKEMPGVKKLLKWVGWILPIHLVWACGSSLSHTDEVIVPNFILIMADDLGYEGIGCFGNKSIQTPALDRMAQEGLILEDYHSNGPVCSPTRAAMLTGQYQQRSGLEGVVYARGPTRKTGLDTSAITLAEILKDHGYATMITGKWHLGYEPEFNPIHHGFDEFYGYVSGNVDFHSHFDNAGVYDWYHNTDTFVEEGYVTDLITEHAVQFIEENKTKPFFLYVPHEAPHVPFQGRNDPAYRFEDNEFSYYGPVEDRERAYREMVEVMDEGVGKILNKVEELSLLENTLIVFVSDNGGEKFGHNGALNGSKGSLYEGGHRVPGLVYWKGQIKPNTVSEATIMSFDWMPTFLSLAGIEIPAQLDGIDLSDHLLNGTPIRSRMLFWRYRDELAVRDGDHKLVVTPSDTLLFNLTDDLEESEDISQTHEKIRLDLLRQAEQWETEMDQLPQKTN